ncbi:hypothetical protein EJ08DRAFT_400609 [Tothia fuscella]|uniref:Uncharacterized protein n=1 Tax=Tothia fuscella TaxID=1048955 RepID=A0A9P4TVC6_9PEZI|nr:hypothetical protein EJ08DRAFT_400609 [Tothia fuscella]
MERERRDIEQSQREGWTESGARQVDYFVNTVCRLWHSLRSSDTVRTIIPLLEFIFNNLPWWTPGDRFRLGIRVMLWIFCWIPGTFSVIVMYLAARLLGLGILG